MYPFKAILVGEATKLDIAREELRASTVEVEAALSDAAATIVWLSQAPQARRLFIMYVGGGGQLEGVKQLRGHCVGQPILVLMGGGEAQELIRLMRAGVDQAVLLPLQPADFRTALESLAWQFGHGPGQSPTVAVVGVTPGSGATTIAVNLAHEMARRGRECILVEGTTRLGKLARQLGVTPRFTTRELAAAGDRLDAHMVEQALISVAAHLRLLAAPADQVQALDPGAQIVRKFLAYLRRLGGVAILETSYNLTKSYYEGLAAVDQVLVLARHTSDALQDLKLVCRSLRQDHGVRTVYPVINRFDRNSRELSIEQVQEALEEPRLLTIAADRSLVARSTAGLERLDQQTFRGAAQEDIQAIARLVLGESESPRSRNNGLFGWLKSVFAGSSAR